jgi:subtilisin family serine protease
VRPRALVVGSGAATAVLLSTMLAPSASAATARPSFERVPLGSVRTYTPLTSRPDHKVTVSLVLGAPSVTEREHAGGRKLSSAERASARRQVEASQTSVRAAAIRDGATVVHDLTDAVNAVTVRVPESAVATLAATPGVDRVIPTRLVKPSNQAADLFTGVGTAWDAYGGTGTGVKVAVIDTGIDYFHADFAGSGNPADFANNDGTVIEPGTFPTAKVVAGYDLVGDAYDASSTDPSKLVPHPDPDPLDCQGHGTHVSGTAAGFGVAGGRTYHGPYTNAALSGSTFDIGPGAAPNALLMAYRVFGCDGSATDADVAAAIDRAVADGADVINMSLGETFGYADSLDTIASDNASLAGTMVVASAGNEGPSAMMTGSPGAASRALAVAAVDGSRPDYPGATIDSTPPVTGLVANGVDVSAAITAPVVVLSDGAGGIGLGCDASEYTNVPAGAIVVTQRGVCARVDRATNGQAAGAAAVIMVNNGSGLPPFEGPIPGVTIPFIGVSSTGGPTLAAIDGQTHTISSAGAIANPDYRAPASFTSAGPRGDDNALKPDVAAPGVSILSAAVGTGAGGEYLSGTSMASPHTAGIAALVAERHPTWTPEQLKAAIMTTATADPADLVGYDPTRLGAGLVQPRRAIDTAVLATTEGGLGTLSFGYRTIREDFRQTRTVTLTNTGTSAVTYRLTASGVGDALGSSVSIRPSRVTVRPGRTEQVRVTMSLSKAAVAALPGAEASDGGDLVSVRGAIVATPTSSGSGVYALRVPYLLVPRGLSDIRGDSSVELRRGTGTWKVTNEGRHAGAADLYALGTTDPRDAPGPTDLRALGTQVLPGEVLGGAADDRTLVFAVNTWQKWGNPGENEVDVAIDRDGDGTPDAFVVGVDLGLVSTGSPNGIYISLILDGSGAIVDAWNAVAPMNGSTMLLPVLASEIGLSDGSGSFSYSAAAISVVGRGTPDAMDGAGTFDAFAPAQSSGDYLPLAPKERANVILSASGNVAGWLAVSFDDATGAPQADVVRARTARHR